MKNPKFNYLAVLAQEEETQKMLDPRKSKCVPIVVLAALFHIWPVASTAYTQTFVINIDPAAYTGKYSAAGQGFVTGPSTLNLAPGTYSLDNGTSVGASAFQFDVDANGDVTSLNTAAATGSGNTLVFNNTTIVIDPGSYTGKYLVDSFFPPTVTGLQTFVVIPGLRYAVDNATLTGFSAFQFDVAANGDVTSLNTAAS